MLPIHSPKEKLVYAHVRAGGRGRMVVGRLMSTVCIIGKQICFRYIETNLKPCNFHILTAGEVAVGWESKADRNSVNNQLPVMILRSLKKGKMT